MKGFPLDHFSEPCNVHDWPACHYPHPQCEQGPQFLNEADWKHSAPSFHPCPIHQNRDKGGLAHLAPVVFFRHVTRFWLAYLQSPPYLLPQSDIDGYRPQHALFLVNKPSAIRDRVGQNLLTLGIFCHLKSISPEKSSCPGIFH